MDNRTLSGYFWQIAELLDYMEEDRFRIRSYQKAAQTIEDYPEQIEDIYRTGGLKGLQALNGIGESISRKIEEAIKHGKPLILKELFKKVPEGILEIIMIPGIGPKFAKLVHERLHISSIKQLEKAAKHGKLGRLPGVKQKKIAKIISGIGSYLKRNSKNYIGDVLPYAEAVVRSLKTFKATDRILLCGSLRRRKEEIGDIDILVSSDDPGKVMESFVRLEQINKIIARGDTKTSVLLKNGMNADLRVVDNSSFGAAAHYLTGSKQHNIKVRTIAIRKHLKVSEYGVFRGEKRIAGKTEEEVFEALGLEYIPPELREDTGEIELAGKGKLPLLVEEKDIKGDLHVHSNYSDGSSSIEEMALEANKMGYEYIAITDHSKSTRVAGGLTKKELIEQMVEIDRINKRLKDFRILKGTEVDILADGTLDFDDTLLKRLDVVVASVHSGFKMDQASMTKRIIKAMNNSNVDILAHPTGRIIGKRDPYEIDVDAIIKAAKASNTVLELNSYPNRLDLDDRSCRLSKEKGVLISVNTDSHSALQLRNISYGIGTARRGWIEKKDVLNCLGLKMLLRRLRARRPEEQ